MQRIKYYSVGFNYRDKQEKDETIALLQNIKAKTGDKTSVILQNALKEYYYMIKQKN